MDLFSARWKSAPRAIGAGCLFSLLALGALPTAGEESAPPVAPPAAETAPPAGAADKAETKAAEDAATAVTGTPPAFPLKARYDEILDTYDDQEEARKIEFPPLEDILVALRACTQEYLAANISKGATYQALMKEPEKHRGEVVRLSGCLRWLQRKEVVANKSGIRQVWQGHLSTEKGYIITFCAIEPPPKNLKVGMGVQLTGIFLKRFAYLNENVGDQLTWSPLLFVRNPQPYSDLEATRTTTWFGFDPFEIVLTLFVGGIVAYLVYSRSKHRMASGNQFTKRKQDRQAKSSAEQLLGDDAPHNIPRPKP